MQTSARGRAFIAEHEGVVLKTYRCPAGVLTIGVGHTAAAGGLKPQPGQRITREQAMDLLERDLARFDARVTATGAFKSQGAHDGAASFDFNAGRIHNATWVKRYKAGDDTAAEASLMQWVKAGGRTLKGLVRRRRAEADLIFRGRYGDIPAGKAARGAPLGKSAISRDPEEVRAYQEQLRALGFYDGPVNGWPDEATLAAVKAFQRSHPHLDADGLVGPATRAALTRAMNLRTRAKQTAGGAAASGGGVAATGESVSPDGATDAFAGVDFTALGLGVGLFVLAVVGGVLAWRYRDEIRHLLTKL